MQVAFHNAPWPWTFEIVILSGVHPVCPALISLRLSVDTQAVAPSRVPRMMIAIGNEREVMVSILRGKERYGERERPGI